MTIANISSQIVSILQSTTHLRTANIYEYAKARPDGYPAAMVTLSDEQSSFADTVRNERHHIFFIRIFQERTKVGDATAERILRETLDELITIFDANYNLNNSCIFAKPISWRMAFLQSPDVDVRVAEISLEAVVVQ